MLPGGGIDRAITVARAAARRVVIIARAWEPDERRYFAVTIEPMLHADALFFGDVGAERRATLLSGAEALVSPVCRHGVSVRIMTEALECGTPILAMAEGAAAEIVEDGQTGYLCADDDEMVHALSKVRRRLPLWRTEPGVASVPHPPSGTGRDRWRRAGVCP